MRPISGRRCPLPVTKTWIDDNSDSIEFLVSTTDIETWGDWEGHLVKINGTEIGRLKDAGNTMGREELFEISYPKADFLALLGGSDSFTLQVELERRSASVGFADDFVLSRISTKHLALKIG